RRRRLPTDLLAGRGRLRRGRRRAARDRPGRARPRLRAGSALLVELADKSVDPVVNVVADLPHLLERPAGGILELPVDVALAGDVRARVAAAHRHDQVGPFGIGALEP